MIKESNLVKNDYKLVYDLKSWLKNNPTDVELTHKLTLDSSSTSGLKGNYGLYATNEWWENIENGNIETYAISGTIIGLNEENPFMEANKVTTIKIDNEEREIYGGVDFTNEETESRYRNLYKVGNKIVTFYVLDELKEDDTWNDIVESKLGILPLINKIYIKEN
ncbi:MULTISPECIES: hypothetical protein [Acinetobacter]|uniref:DUF4178 domain-containing protein n=1 Tax=Acinetobacter corruptisaponis TaxID=3045147 RepID=A0ABY8S5F1_9GAMM|nr:hypothetical protein [Acinetobacter sp. KCTC 92772]WHP06656.1 hypothetical protein QLH32_04075 [Acinetobacter sp. KCTC 92772]